MGESRRLSSQLLLWWTHSKRENFRTEECDRSEGRGDEDGGSHYSRCGAQEEERSLYDEQQYDIHGDEDPTMPFDNDAGYD